MTRFPYRVVLRGVFFFLVVLTLLSCQWVSSLDNGKGPWPVPTSSSTPMPPTLTLAPTLTSTFPPTPTPTPTFTLTPTPAPIRFAVIGDFGLGTQPEQDVANLIKNWQPDFIITVGDNNYPSGEVETIDAHIGQYYAEYIFPYTGDYGPGGKINRFFPTFGNHDLNTDNGKPQLDYFTLPGNERYYDFIWGPLHFFALNSDSREPDGVSRISIQAQWLQAGLAASQQPWKIVYFHHSPYSSGPHGGIDWMQWPFAEWGADVVFAGHNHVYERLDMDGIPLFINGLGGGPIYDFPNLAAGSLMRYNDDYGAMFVVADDRQMTFQFITRTGQMIDSFQLVR